jgi:uncharacterized phage protein gp47/JayE
MSLTETGFSRPRLAEIKSDLDQRLAEAFGPINTGPDSVLGQLNGIHAAALDDLWEQAEDVYNSMYPATAEGVSLDRAVSLLGLTRIPAAPVVVTAAVYGAQGTIVPANAMVRSDVSYYNTSRVTISRFRAIDVTVSVPAVFSGTTYSIVIDGELYSYMSSSAATALEILGGLQTAIGTDYTTSISNLALRISAPDGETPFALGNTDNLNLDRVGSPAVFVAVNPGARELPIGALQFIDTPIYGWEGVSNLRVGEGSRDVESDIELRLRQTTASRATGSATVKAIRARLLAEVPGVETVSIYENRTQNIVNSMPPHSFETIVQGGLDQLVANNIWANKPAGIETYGNVTMTVTDDNGESQPVRFSRAVPEYLWVRVTVNSYYSEEVAPATTVAAIKAAVVDTASKLAVGEDVITQRFIGPIYAATTGIGLMTIETALTASPNDVPVYSETNKPITRSQTAVASLDRVTVVLP